MKHLFLSAVVASTALFSFPAPAFAMTNTVAYAKKTPAEEADETIGVKEGMEYPEAMKIIQDEGYTHTTNYQGEDWTTILSLYPEEDQTDFVIVSIDKFSKKDKTISFTVNTKSNLSAKEKAAADKAALEKKLPAIKAWDAVEKYGKKQYDSFKLHYVMGKIVEECEDENTWVLKAECTVNKKKMMCEARVSGTEAAPVVSDFDVY